MLKTDLFMAVLKEVTEDVLIVLIEVDFIDDEDLIVFADVLLPIRLLELLLVSTSEVYDSLGSCDTILGHWRTRFRTCLCT